MCYPRPKHFKTRSETQPLWDWDEDIAASRFEYSSPGHIALPLKPHAARFALVVAATSVVLCLVAIQALADQATTNLPPLTYQVLDEKPADMMLNFFKEQARPMPRNHAAPTTLEQWEHRRVELRRQLWDSLGTFPLENRTPLNARIVGRIDHGDHLVEK